MRQVQADLGPATAGRPIDWRIGPLPVIECDPVLMKLVLVNLISNAVKFTRPRSPAVIEVGTINHDGEDVIFVPDKGAGFDKPLAVSTRPWE